MTKAKFIFLGTGGSTGVPLVACPCAVCQSTSPYNKRLRVSGLIKVDGKNFVIDVGPDFRTQMLRAHVNKLDGVILTHSHFDHIAGIDDLRGFIFTQKKPIPCLLSQDTLDEVKIRYHYLMPSQQTEGVTYTQLDFQIMDDDFGSKEFCGLKWHYVSYFQTGMKVNGYILGNLAYVSDIREYSDEVSHALRGVDTLILGALRYTPSPGHFNIEEAIAFAREVGAKKTYLTHIGHELDHEETNKQLPPDVRLAYDGLEIEFDTEKK